MASFDPSEGIKLCASPLWSPLRLPLSLSPPAPPLPKLRPLTPLRLKPPSKPRLLTRWPRLPTPLLSKLRPPTPLPLLLRLPTPLLTNLS
jgi:hypothetical protein